MLMTTNSCLQVTFETGCHHAGCAGYLDRMSCRLCGRILAQAKTYIGKTYKVLINVQDLCPAPDFPINQGNNCVLVTDHGATTVVDVVEAHGEIFAKLRTSDGREGYVPEEDVRLLDRETKPSPKIGMSESEALDTSWGEPDKRNTTETAGHRSEQWVFPSFGYLYIEDGVLRSIQRTD